MDRQYTTSGQRGPGTGRRGTRRTRTTAAEKKEPAGHGAGVAVDAGAAVVRGEERGAAAGVVDAAVVEADITEAAVVAAVDAGAVWRVVVGATAAKHELDAVCTVTYVNEFGDHATDRTLELRPAERHQRAAATAAPHASSPIIGPGDRSCCHLATIQLTKQSSCALQASPACCRHCCSTREQSHHRTR